MSKHVYVFIADDQSAESIANTVGKALEGAFSVGPDGDLLLMLDKIAVNVGTHEFDDGDVSYADGSGVPLETEFPHQVEIRDFERDYERQLAIGQAVFDALKDNGKWKVIFTEDLQSLEGVYIPPDSTLD